MRDLVEGLDHLHKSLICHRDIKPQNILLDENNVAKFADFGSSDFIKAANDDYFTDSTGTYQFFAPEMLEREPRYSGRAADIWALGIVLYALTYNCVPFDDANETELFRKIKEESLGLAAHPR